MMAFIDHTDSQTGGLVLSQCEKPNLLPGQVLVKVEAFGVNRADTLQRQGKYPAPLGESPILGLEVAGTIVNQSDSGDKWQVGQRVFGLVAGGGYAQYVAVNKNHLMAIPKAMSYAEAAGIAETFLTAHQSLFMCAYVSTSQKCLIHAGASGVGLAAIQLASVIGCDVATTASSERKLDACREQGASICINYQQQDFYEVIKQRWGGVDFILDFVGGDYLNRNLRSLKMDGVVVYLAMLGGRYADKLDMALLLSKRAQIVGSTLRNRSEEFKSRLVSEFEHRFLHLFDSGELHPNIDTIFTANEIGVAHSRMENNDSAGKFIGVWS